MSTFDASANPTLPGVDILIGGRERQMAFCFKSIAALEKKYEQSCGKLLSQMDTLSITADLLHAALWRDDPKLTPDQVGEWINFFNLKTIQDAILAAWFGSMPKDEASGEAEAQAETEA